MLLADVPGEAYVDYLGRMPEARLTMKKEDKQILKIEVKHDDPEIERQGAQAVKDLN
jgi:hypothetical protein